MVVNSHWKNSSVVIVAFFATVMIVASLTLVLPIQQGPLVFYYPPAGQLYQFESKEHIIDYMRTHLPDNDINYYSGEVQSGFDTLIDTLESGAADSPPPHSTTNVQVEGVDEPDLVKTDGYYIYTISNGTLFVIQAYPAETAQLINQIEPQGWPRSLFLFESSWLIVLSYLESGAECIEVFDITEPSNILLSQTIMFDGNFRSARLIGKYLYYVGYSWPLDEERNVQLPELMINQRSMIILPWDIYFDPGIYDNSFYYNIVMGLDITDPDAEPNTQTILAGARAGVIYTSLTNMYVAAAHYPRGDWYSRQTAIHRFAIHEGQVTYHASGVVPGYLINQFALDEYNYHLRAATTGWINMTDPQDPDNWDIELVSNIYVLDMQMEIVGSLEGLAPREWIYSVRFQGSIGYLVTFYMTDPLFVVDLTHPSNPQLLGELEIPGYSNYLHPLGNDQVLGIGKNVSFSDSWWWYTGMKLSLFNATDPCTPEETATMIIGVRGTTSPALYDHHAVLIDPQTQLLVLPIYLREYTIGPPEHTSELGDLIWAGAYVFYINPDTATITIRGQITHVEDPTIYENYQYWYLDWIGMYGWYPTTYFIHRSLYIDNVLYTISSYKIAMHALDTLTPLGTISLLS
ncbi:MAG: beta-propeller domain-containing protein [Candidatus Thorarchaeota archaeon]